jgi:putative ABC transport system ATP-binding protein
MSSLNSYTPKPLENAVTMSSVTFSYPTSDAVLNCNDWSLKKGERIFLHGNSGSGKSTLLNLLSGIALPDKGKIELNNTSLNKLSPKQRDRYRARNIGIVFQQFNLIPYMTVMQNIELAVFFAKSSKDTLAKLHVMLDKLNLPNSILLLPASQLSVGQKQRVAIIRALINAPNLLLIDEPTSALDSEARDGFMQMLMAVEQSEEATMVFVSHDPSLSQYFTQHIAVADICHWQNTRGSVC